MPQFSEISNGVDKPEPVSNVTINIRPWATGKGRATVPAGSRSYTIQGSNTTAGEINKAVREALFG